MPNISARSPIRSRNDVDNYTPSDCRAPFGTTNRRTANSADARATTLPSRDDHEAEYRAIIDSSGDLRNLRRLAVRPDVGGTRNMTACGCERAYRHFGAMPDLDLAARC